MGGLLRLGGIGRIVAPIAEFLLQEDSFKFILEDGTGFLLLE